MMHIPLNRRAKYITFTILLTLLIHSILGAVNYVYFFETYNPIVCNVILLVSIFCAIIAYPLNRLLLIELCIYVCAISTFFLFKPPFSTFDAYQILERNGFQDIHICAEYPRMSLFYNTNPFVNCGIIFEGSQQGDEQVVLFNLQNGEWYNVESIVGDASLHLPLICH